MINIIGDWESGNGEWEHGMGNENVILSTSKNGGEWGMGIGESGMGNGFQNGEWIRGDMDTFESALKS